MKVPLVSIVIPCFNAEDYVADAINSALAQTYPYKEVIVIDDGSTDGSSEIIRSYGDHIQWESGPNRGGCVARNRGLELAQGELIQFLDADDILFTRKLESQVPIAIAHPDRVVYCDHVAIWEDSEREAEIMSAPLDSLDAVVFVLRQHQFFQTSAPLYHREWLTAIRGFRPGLRGSQDFDLNLRLAGWGSVVGSVCQWYSSKYGVVQVAFQVVLVPQWHV